MWSCTTDLSSSKIYSTVGCSIGNVICTQVCIISDVMVESVAWGKGKISIELLVQAVAEFQYYQWHVYFLL